MHLPAPGCIIDQDMDLFSGEDGELPILDCPSALATESPWGEPHDSRDLSPTPSDDPACK
jgi:hypothetical protein